jgi:hypothetical protein
MYFTYILVLKISVTIWCFTGEKSFKSFFLYSGLYYRQYTNINDGNK